MKKLVQFAVVLLAISATGCLNNLSETPGYDMYAGWNATRKDARSASGDNKPLSAIDGKKIVIIRDAGGSRFSNFDQYFGSLLTGALLARGATVVESGQEDVRLMATITDFGTMIAVTLDLRIDGHTAKLATGKAVVPSYYNSSYNISQEQWLMQAVEFATREAFKRF
jgi:hypothetical protein